MKAISDQLSLGEVQMPLLDYASQGNAILGIRDSGKSYTATHIAERLLDAGIPFIAFDPIGVWRYLRVAGKGAGYPVVVAGDDGDLPLDPESAPEIVRSAMQENIPLVIDLYSMKLSKADWRRIVENSIRLLLYENKGCGLRHIFIEEAAEFVPQMVSREYAHVYAECEKLARMGGNASLGYTLINQRAEQVNKAVLELCDCLFLHRQKGRASLTALGKWLDFSGAESKTIIQKLPVLSQGECYVWPAGTEKPRFTKIPEKRSLHPDRRSPDVIKHGKATLDVSGFVERMKNRADAMQAERARSKPDSEKPSVQQQESPRYEEIKVPVFRDGEVMKMEQAARRIEEAITDAEQVLADLREQIEKADKLTRWIPFNVDAPLPPKAVIKRGEREWNEKGMIGHGGRKILGVLAARHPARYTQSQLGTLSGFTPSTMRTYMPPLRASGYIRDEHDGIGITEGGLKFIGDDLPTIPQRGRELLEFWMSKLRLGEARILETLYEAHGRELSMETLEQRTGFTNSTLRTYIPTLRRNDLIDQNHLRISPEFLGS